jgi:acyl dehydratase
MSVMYNQALAQVTRWGKMNLAEYAGTDLGTRAVAYDDRDPILYALAVGAGADDLDLIYERRLKVLPTFALTLGLWVADAASAAGAFTPEGSLHGSQRLAVHRALPRSGAFEVRGTLAAVWDKGRSAVLDVVAESEYFTATYAIFLPGRGGFGGEAGPRSSVAAIEDLPWSVDISTRPDQAALYRLTGDRHLIHVDPDAARQAGFPRPILHGLCTLGTAARGVASAAAAEPWELTSISARFSAPMYPGAALRVRAAVTGGVVNFGAESGGAAVLTAGQATFG